MKLCLGMLLHSDIKAAWIWFYCYLLLALNLFEYDPSPIRGEFPRVWRSPCGNQGMEVEWGELP